MPARVPSIFFLSLFVLCLATAPQQTLSDKLKAPSENAGRKGTYQCKTSHNQYNYYVYVPESYSDTNPAGLHVYFHGQSGQSSAEHFGNWAKHFCEPYNLIGINMQYMDGNNAKDTAGKVEAARQAIEQTQKDYKIVSGRGAMACFSGGGLPAGMFFSQSGKLSANPLPVQSTSDWYFNHISLYGANFHKPAGGGKPMTWYIGVGTKEWNMGGPTLGSSQTGRMNDLLQDVSRGGVQDMIFYVIKDKGHTISDEDVEQSAKLFNRSDLAFTPFLYTPDFTESELNSIVAHANKLALGSADKALKKLLAKPNLDPAIKEKAERIQKTMNERVDRILALCKELSENDPFLCDYYGKMFAKQLAGHPREAELKPILSPAGPKARKIAPLFGAFIKQFSTFFNGPQLKDTPENVQLLENIKKEAGEKSELGVMADHFLQLK